MFQRRPTVSRLEEHRTTHAEDSHDPEARRGTDFPNDDSRVNDAVESEGRNSRLTVGDPAPEDVAPRWRRSIRNPPNIPRAW